jgi:hypothetical protein
MERDIALQTRGGGSAGKGEVALSGITKLTNLRKKRALGNSAKNASDAPRAAA